MNDFKENIIQKIKSGEIDMRPKWHFVLKAVLLISGIVLSALLAIYLISFVFFTLHRSGILFAPKFGLKGVWLFLHASPWLLMLLALAFLSTLYILVKKYSFAYRRPLLYSMIGVLFFVSLVSFALERAEIHDRIHMFTEQHPLPGVTPLYRNAINSASGQVFAGAVEEIGPEILQVLAPTGERYVVLFDETTRMRPRSAFEIGEKLLIFGEKDGGDVIRAFGIKKVGETFRRRFQATDQEGQLMKSGQPKYLLPDLRPQ